MSDSGREFTEGELVAWGEDFGRRLKAPAVVTLAGDLGAGKTTLTQAICRGFGVKDDVTSPTFAIVHLYGGAAAPVYHVDLYRLNGPRDLQNIGWDDMMRSDAVVLVEWPERAEGSLPREVVALELQFVPGDGARRRLVQREHSGAAT